MTPVTVDLAITGAKADTTIAVRAAVQGTTGPLRLTVEVPAGVTLVGAEGDWSPCTQGAGGISCTGPEGTAGRWFGTIHTAWADSAKGRVRATVAGTYANGSAATGSVGTSWPP
jgi:hypothetical protein